jgi:hypothetical protein
LTHNQHAGSSRRGYRPEYLVEIDALPVVADQ